MTDRPPEHTHAEIMEMLEHSAIFLQAALSGLKNERLENEPVVARASVRDIVSHLAAWEEEFYREARESARSASVRFDYSIEAGTVAGDCLLATLSGPGRWDDEQMQRRSNLGAGAVFLELEQTQHRLLEFVRRLPERKLRRPAVWPWGRCCSLAELLVVAATHKRAHAQLIRDWRARGRF